MYIVKDNHGTRQICWTFTQAMEWLPFCADQAAIVGRFSGRVIATRTQEI
jgi:hypothetical protein